MKCEFFIKHSPSIVKKYVSNPRYAAVLVLALLFPYVSQAQMFSVDSGPGMRGLPGTAVYAGYEQADFAYRGPAGGGDYAFSGPVARLRLETPGLDLFIGSGGKLTGLDDVTYFDAGLKAGYGLGILRRENFIIQLPFQLMTSVTSAVNRNTVGLNTQFQQGSLVAGLGGAIAVRPSRGIRFRLNVVPSYGFSFATGNTFGGSLASLEGQARIFVDRVFGNTGLSLGYDYNSRKFNIDEDAFDYILRSHSILIGITF